MSKRELQYALLSAAGLMLLTCVPYVVVWFFTPLEHVFPGVLFNSDDHGVYFAWMQQARDSRVLFRNLLTNAPQRGLYFHAYFLVLGWLSALPGLSIPVAYHVGRVVFGTLTLVLVYRLAAFFTPHVLPRRCVFWTTALSAGLGWIWWAEHADQAKAVDVWQPEALTFLSLYTNGLFAVSLALMLGVVICLLLAERHGWRWAVGAGLCGLLLGNIHSYDVIHLTAAWGTYLLLRWAVGRRFPAREVGHALLAAAVAAPSVAYMAWFYKTEPLFQYRADIPTRSPFLWQYLLGYGLLIPLALWGASVLWKSKDTEPSEAPGDPLRKLLPIGWAVTGLAVAYAPFAFQRKMIMGEHLPLALLAGLAVADVARRAAARTGRPRVAPLVAAGLIGVLSISSVRFVVRDLRVAFTQGLTSTGVHPVFWPESQVRALEWMGENTRKDAVLLTFPLNGVLAPAFSGRAVFAGHWAETPDFPDQVAPAFRFYHGVMSSDERREYLRSNGITHVLWSPMDATYVEQMARGRHLPPQRPLSVEPFLKPVFTEGQTVLYAVQAL